MEKEELLIRQKRGHFSLLKNQIVNRFLDMRWQSLFVFSSILMVLVLDISWLKMNNNVEVTWLYCLIYLLCLGGMIYSYYKIVINYQHKNKGVKTTIVLIFGILLFSLVLPILSSDIFIYLQQGQLALNGILTYTNGANNALHPFIQYVDVSWRECPNHYGPLPMLMFVITTALAGESVILNIIILKLFFVLIVACLIFILMRIQSSDNERKNKIMLFIVLNPVFLIQGLGQTHIDLLTCLLCVTFIIALLKNKWVLAGIIVGLLGSTKFLLFVIFVGILILFFMNRWVAKELSLKKAFLSLLSAFMTIIITYTFIWEGWATITNPMSFHDNQEPVKSLTELLSYILSYFDFSGVASSIADYGNEVLDVKNYYGLMIGKIFKILALVLAIPLVLSSILAKEKTSFIRLMGLLLLLVFIVYSPRMHPWYFLLILPFFAYGAIDKKHFIIYAAIVFGLSNSYEVSNILPLEDNARNIIVIVFTIISVLSYFLYFKRFFLSFKIKSLFYQLFKEIKFRQIKF
jgi:hypothetical protein